MPTLAILGATSQIASDYILGARADETLHLFSRRPEAVTAWLARERIERNGMVSRGYDAFGADDYDAIINFVGIGDPAKAKAMGAGIFETTRHYDELACAYLQNHPRTRYVFLSSGAVYGTTFLQPAGPNTPSCIDINNLSEQEYYSVAKLYAEARHRSMTGHAVVDVRVFNYFSSTLDLGARFFVTDMLRAIRDETEFATGSATMHRDFLTPIDFRALINAILASAPANTAVDAYSKAPVEKFELLEAMRNAFGLRYRVTPSPPTVNATGAKPAYYSVNRKAAEFGYQPHLASVEGVIAEGRKLLNRSGIGEGA